MNKSKKNETVKIEKIDLNDVKSNNGLYQLTDDGIDEISHYAEDMPFVRNREYLFFDKLKFKKGSYCEALKYIHFAPTYISIHFNTFSLVKKILDDPAMAYELKKIPYQIYDNYDYDNPDFGIVFTTVQPYGGKTAKAKSVINLIFFMINNSQMNYKEFLMMQESIKKLKSLIDKFNSLSLPTLDLGYVSHLEAEYHETSFDIKEFNEYKNNTNYEMHQLIKINRLYPIRMKNIEKVWDQLNKQ